MERQLGSVPGFPASENKRRTPAVLYLFEKGLLFFPPHPSTTKDFGAASMK